jgi:hypothetical protein
VSGDSSLDKLVYGFIAIVLILAFFAPQYITLATNVFVFLLVDNIQGMIVGAIIGAFLSPKITIAGIPVGAILGVIGQYLLFH